MKSKQKAFLYRVEAKDKSGRKRKHVAEVRADCDENARRKIIHTAIAEGGSVQMISTTDDASRYPGETVKRNYGD